MKSVQKQQEVETSNWTSSWMQTPLQPPGTDPDHSSDHIKKIYHEVKKNHTFNKTSAFITIWLVLLCYY